MMRITSAGQLCRVTVAGSTTPVCTSKFTLVSGATCTLLKARVTCVRCSELKLTLEALVDPVVAPAFDVLERAWSEVLDVPWLAPV